MYRNGFDCGLRRTRLKLDLRGAAQVVLATLLLPSMNSGPKQGGPKTSHNPLLPHQAEIYDQLVETQITPKQDCGKSDGPQQ